MPSLTQQTLCSTSSSSAKRFLWSLNLSCWRGRECWFQQVRSLFALCAINKRRDTSVLSREAACTCKVPLGKNDSAELSRTAEDWMIFRCVCVLILVVSYQERAQDCVIFSCVCVMILLRVRCCVFSPRGPHAKWYMAVFVWMLTMQKLNLGQWRSKEFLKNSNTDSFLLVVKAEIRVRIEQMKIICKALNIKGCVDKDEVGS